MVALKGKSIDGALKQRATQFSAFLVYGPDQGLVRERATRLARQIVSDLSDPFNFMELGESDLKAEPGRLSDEITALSFMGGERVIRVRSSGEGASPAVTGFLNALEKDRLKPNGIVIIEGGDLGPRSGLRKAFEKARRAASLPCYEDGAGQVRTLAEAMASAHGLRFEPDAMALVVQILGQDRAMTRSELEKLMFYKSPGPDAPGGTPARDIIAISLDDVRASLADSSGAGLDDISAQCTNGYCGPLSHALYRASLAGTSPVALLRALQRNFSRLQQARAHMDAGANPDVAMKKLRPPVFFGEQDAFRARLNLWSMARLRSARRALTQAELDAKTTGAPQREIVERTALRLARMVRR